MLIRSCLVMVVILGVLTKSFAQSDLKIKAQYQRVSFKEVVVDLESKYDLYFYYHPELDSIPVTLNFDNIDLEPAIEQLSLQCGSKFYIDDNRVIATDAFEVDTRLPSSFYKQKSQLPQKAVDTHLSVLADIKEITVLNQKQSIESKIIDIGEVTKRFEGSTASLTGYMRDIKTGEPVIGASIFKKDPVVGTVTDAYGYYAMTLPKGKYELFINSIGMKATKRIIVLNSDGTLDIDLTPDVIALKEVVITEDENPVDRLQTGFAKIDVKSIRQIPSVMGEADIMKIALNLPGVQTVGEGASGFNVRGGSVGQNLVLLDDMSVYNTSHLFGFFSVFNPDVISSANLYKSGINASYGGRIASVFDVELREGNKRRFNLSGGISPVTGKLTVEGPIKKDTTSYIFGVRSTYSDWLFSLLEDPNLRNSTGAFSDFVTKVNHRFDQNNSISVSAYHSRDKFRLGQDSTYSYYNSAIALKWRHVFSSKLHKTSSFSYSGYNYDIVSDESPTNAFELGYDLGHYKLKTHFHYMPKQNVNIEFGLSSSLYALDPGYKTPIGASSLVIPINIDQERGLETAFFGDYEYNFSSRLSASVGLRLSIFNSLGPGQVYSYASGFPKEISSITDTTSYGAGEIIHSYIGPEPRIGLRYKLMDDLSLKLSYDRINQYIHVLSNTTAISPTDSWRLSSAHVKPQIGDQLSVGFYKTFFGTSLELSLEGYYKSMQNVLEFKDGADLQLNEAIETDIIGAFGKAYGVEFMMKKSSGVLTGWLSYTYSRSLLQANGDHPSETINSGNFYPSNYDKPHSLVLVSNIKCNRRLNISVNMNYSTGRPATYPISKYYLRDQAVLYYTDRNEYRIPDYFRVDLGINIEGNHRVAKKIHGSYSFSIYNLTGRANAFSVFFRSNGDEIQGYKMSILNRAIPTFTYHFKLN